jgi:predicted nucleotidyltransferase
LRWPDAKTVDKAVRKWANRVIKDRPEVVKIGYFGSYARGNWGVGSDLDLIIIVEGSEKPFIGRSSEWDATDLPVHADVLVYTKDEWKTMMSQRGYYKTLAREIIWVKCMEK